MKINISILLLLFLPFLVFPAGNREKNGEKKKLEKAEKQWVKNGFDIYEIKLIYKRGNFPDDIITIRVSENGLNWETEGKGILSEELISSLTVEGLFKRVENNLNSVEKSPFVIRAEYDDQLGYIKVLTRSPPEEALSSGRFPRDANYRIEVMKITPGEEK